MAVVDMNSIAKKCKAWSETQNGKKRMREEILQKARSGQRYSGCGDELVTDAVMDRLAMEMIDMLKRTAASYDLAPSVMAHFDKLVYTSRERRGGTMEYVIYFADDLSRESLTNHMREEDDYIGIDNIVALFNNGYVASKPVYGLWYGHESTVGSGQYRSLPGVYAYVKSRQARPSLHFMQQAIEDFCAKYSKKYNLTIELADMYDGNYSGSLNGVLTEIK